MESTRKMGTADVTRGAAPPWPANDKIWWEIVDKHNNVDAGEFTTELLSGSKSITLVMICHVRGIDIPMTYRLDTKRAGLHSHHNAVRMYLKAVGDGVSPVKHGKTIESAINYFAEDKKLGVSVKDVNEGLALKYGINKPFEGIRAELHRGSSSGEYPSREDAIKILRPLRGEAHEDAFKVAVETSFAKEGRTLIPGWWEVTKKNMLEWSK